MKKADKFKRELDDLTKDFPSLARLKVEACLLDGTYHGARGWGCSKSSTVRHAKMVPVLTFLKQACPRCLDWVKVTKPSESLGRFATLLIDLGDLQRCFKALQTLNPESFTDALRIRERLSELNRLKVDMPPAEPVEAAYEQVESLAAKVAKDTKAYLRSPEGDKARLLSVAERLYPDPQFAESFAGTTLVKEALKEARGKACEVDKWVLVRFTHRPWHVNDTLVQDLFDRYEVDRAKGVYHMPQMAYELIASVLPAWDVAKCRRKGPFDTEDVKAALVLYNPGSGGAYQTLNAALRATRLL